MQNSDKRNIRDLNLSQLQAEIPNQPSFRANQIYDWLWKKGVKDFNQMTNLSKALREELNQKYIIHAISANQIQKSNDGTIKNRVKLHDYNIVESVLIPTSKRITACVSSQVGCSLDCKFCATASLKRMRNLNVDEIIDQVQLINAQGLEFYNKPLSNIVFMGMGEPMLNYKNVLKSIDIITSDKGLAMSPRRITLSTSGIPKMIEKLGEDKSKVKLALSLHSAIEEKRNKIMPFSQKFPLVELKASLKKYYQQTKSIITIEYIIWKGINDKEQDIDALVKFCNAVPSKVNIIEYNAIDGGDFLQADIAVIDSYVRKLEAAKIVARVRRSRGKDIDAACGQLANKELI